MNKKTIELRRPDDWHVHLRDQAFLCDTVAASAKHFARILVMPNLKPPLTNLQLLLEYRERILQQLSVSGRFEAFMSFYLNDDLSLETLSAAKAYPFILGAKLYPAGVTTNSEAGAKSIQGLYPHFEQLQEQNLVLQIHGETHQGDIFDREALFLSEHLAAILKNFPKLRVVLEHISSKAAVDFVLDGPQQLAATITPQHLLYNRNDLLGQGMKPHLYCLPILKSRGDQAAVQAAACSGSPKFFAGTDSAPHAQGMKEAAQVCAGIYSAPYALALYAEVFETLGRLEKLNDFMSRFGAEFYQQALSLESIELIKQKQTIPAVLPFGNDQVVPIAAGESISWTVADA